MPDPEIEAMSHVTDALTALDDEEAKSRVLRWAAEKFGVILPQAGSQDGAKRRQPADEPHLDEADLDDPDDADMRPPKVGTDDIVDDYARFAELFAAVQPSSALERALTAAYWEQVISDKREWQSQSINKELKEVGHYDGNINRTLTEGISKKPQLVLQLKKTGATRQGRKTYKLSTEGVKFVRARIAANA